MTGESITIFKGDTSRLRNVVPIAERMTPEFFEREREMIFGRAWLPVASASDVAGNGDYVVVDVPPMKASLIVVRGDDGTVRAFHNICRHRGDRLIHPGSGRERGCRKAFTCGFHAWTYSNTGKLVRVTDEGQFEGLDKEKLGLLAVHAEVWEDLVFVNFDTRPRETLRDWLGDIYDQYTGFFAGRQKIADHRIVLKTNWNVAVNAFCEGYHNLYIHKHTVPDYQGGSGNAVRHRPYIEVGRNFGRYSAHANRKHRRTPAEAVIYGASRPLFPSFPEVDVDSLPPGVNPSRFAEWAFDIVHVVPNVIIGPQASGHSYMWFWPIDHQTTDIRVQRFAFASDRPSDRVAHAYSKVRFREVLREDLATMEAVADAVSTGALPSIVLSQQELLIQNHYRAADDMLARN